MKKTLKILGIILIIVGILALLLGLLWRFAYYHTMDGTGDMYRMQYRNMWISFIAGVISVIAGVVCLVRRKKL